MNDDIILDTSKQTMKHTNILLHIGNIYVIDNDSIQKCFPL